MSRYYATNLGAIFETLSFMAQIRYFRQAKSIYGYSLNFLMKNFIEKLLFFASALSYLTQRLTRDQYSKRFPVYPSVPFSNIIWYTDCCDLGLMMVLCCQCLKYRRSCHLFQTVSISLAWIVILFLGVSFLILYNATINFPEDIGRYGLLYIDFVDWIWISGAIFGSLKYTSQVSLNWIGMCTKGLSLVSLGTDLLAVSIQLLVRVMKHDHRDETFHFDPVVSKTKMSIAQHPVKQN